MPEFFRIDEFALAADSDITVRDRVRFSCVGFDLTTGVPVGPWTPTGPPGVSGLWTPIAPPAGIWTPI